MKEIPMTPSKENYLKKIVELGGDQNVINNKQLSEAMGVSAASVTEMNNRLVKEGLITYVPYKGVQATEEGLKTANKLIRNHRLWEVFLSDKLGYEWNEVHEDADYLEHVSSDKLMQRLDEYLGRPTHDPHGGVIPNQDGTVEQVELTVLTELQNGQYFIVEEVKDDREILEYLTSKNVELKGRYQLVEIDAYEGPVTLKTDQNDPIILSYQAACRIYVKKDV